MEYFDFLEAPCLKSAETDPHMRADGFHAIVNNGEDFGYKALQRAAGLPVGIPTSATEGSLLLDVGGGFKPFWDSETMRRRNVGHINVDFEDNAIAANWRSFADIAVDLNRLPDEFFSAPDLTTALKNISPKVGKYRDQIQRLLTLIERPVGAVALSHVLCYVRRERVRKLIQLALSSLETGGSAWIMDVAPAYFQNSYGVKGFTDGFAEATDIIATDDRFTVAEHSLLVPRIHTTELPAYQTAAEQEKEGGHAFSAMQFCQLAVLRDARRLIRLPFVEGMDDGTQESDPDGLIGVPWYGEHVMRIQRK